MLNLTIVSSSIEKSFTFPSQETSLESLAANLLDMLPVESSFIVRFKPTDFFSINKQITIIAIIK